MIAKRVFYGWMGLALVLLAVLVFQADAQVGARNSCRVISAASTNATLCVGRGALVGTIHASNVNAAARYLKLYDKATAPTVGTDTPRFTVLIPGAATGGQASIAFPIQPIFQNGLGLALTTGVADSDTAAVAANEIVVHVAYRER